MGNESSDAGELGPAMEQLTAREQLFVRELFRPGTTAAAAARAAGFGEPDSKNSTFARIAYRKRSQPHIVKAIVEECQRTVKSLGPEALAGMREIIADKRHKDRGKMIRFVVDKIDPTLIQHQHDVTVKVEDPRLEAIKVLRWMRDELGVPREKLVEHFGHSGLGVYERMEREGLGGQKLIEASPAGKRPPSAVTSVRHRVDEPDDQP